MQIDNINRSTICLADFIGKLNQRGSFVIPDYQRGYVWGQKPKHASKEVDSVTYMLRTILDGLQYDRDIFIQGVTVHESGDDIVLVDGQQRTTFFYLLLKFLGYDSYLSIRYDVRTQSNDFLHALDVSDCKRDDDEEFQDIFFFKRTLRIFARNIDTAQRDKLRNYILNHIRFLYINIEDASKARIVFTMMNGNKAQMRQAELIKSELLRRSSLTSADSPILPAENIEIRGRMARAWDRWLHWWNRPDIKAFFNIKKDKPLGWLLPLYAGNDSVTLEDYRRRLNDKADTESDVRKAKTLFKELTLLQNRLEDAFNDSAVYNKMGAILRMTDSSRIRSFLQWYSDSVVTIGKDVVKEQLSKYLDWTVIGMSHDEIVKTLTTSDYRDAYKSKRKGFYKIITERFLYSNDKQAARRWLLRNNVLEDCAMAENNTAERRFDFSIWDNYSLEHIKAKSMVFHKDEYGHILNTKDEIVECPLPDNAIMREDMPVAEISDKEKLKLSEHCLGNLVLLYKDDNSTFGKKDFEPKKKAFFDINDSAGFKSRHLLHTVSVFARSQWGPKEIRDQMVREINRFINEYPETL